MAEKRRFTVVCHRSVIEEFDEVQDGNRVHGTRRVAVEDIEATVEVAVDWDAIADKLGRKAFDNKSQAAHEASGMIKARVIFERMIGFQKLGKPVVLRRKEVSK